ncbi:ABC transporter substrate-binding protein [Patescibacteria group bacterium]|nr:ABC transporter substrate-binding protein [Patescibacteria group bacterium]
MNKAAKIILWVVIAVIIIAGIWYGVSKEQVEEKVFKIGAIVPLSVSGANMGQPLVNGMDLAISEINEKAGINGYKLKLYAEDNQFSGEKSVSAVNFLLNTINPDIYVSLFALPTNSISPVLREAKKPLIYEAYSRTALKDNLYAFKANFDSETGCEKLVRYLKGNKKYKKLGVIFSKSDYNEECLMGIKSIEPDVKEYWYVFGEKDFKTIFGKAKNDEVDRLITIGIEFEFVNMFKQLTELGYDISMACATASECITPKVKEVANKELLEKTISIDFIDVNIDETVFAEKYSNEHPNASFIDLAYGAIGYEEVMYISKAMESCEPGESACLIESLKNVKDYNTILGSNGFKDRVLQLSVKLYQYENGNWQVIE